MAKRSRSARVPREKDEYAMLIERRSERVRELREIAGRVKKMRNSKLLSLNKHDRALVMRFLQFDVPQLLAEAHVAVHFEDDPLTRQDLRRINAAIIRLDSALKMGLRVNLSPWMRNLLIVLEGYDTTQIKEMQAWR
jgi:hypothetical protein